MYIAVSNLSPDEVEGLSAFGVGSTKRFEKTGNVSYSLRVDARRSTLRMPLASFEPSSKLIMGFARSFEIGMPNSLSSWKARIRADSRRLTSMLKR